MAEETVKLEGADKLIKLLKAAPAITQPYLKAAMDNSLALLQDEVAQYPASSEANRPGRTGPGGRPMGYYERGRGWWYPVRQVSGPTGKGRGQVRTKNVSFKLAKKNGQRGSSEALGRKWTSQSQIEREVVVGQTGNTVSYAEYVQGHKQANFHAQRGWGTIDAAMQKHQAEIQANFKAALDEATDALSKL